LLYVSTYTMLVICLSSWQYPTGWDCNKYTKYWWILAGIDKEHTQWHLDLYEYKRKPL